MDPFLRSQVDGMLADLWEGTDVELALKKANLRIEVDVAPGRDFLALFVENLKSAMSDSTEKVKATFDGDTFEAVPYDEVVRIINEEYDQVGDE